MSANSEGGKVEVIDMGELQQAGEEFIAAYEKLAKIIHEDNVKKGFWPWGGREKVTEDRELAGSRNVGEALMLAVSELSEALEAYRKNKNDDHLPEHLGITVEIGDCMIRLMDLGYGYILPVSQALVQKLHYNRNRPHKHGKSF